MATNLSIFLTKQQMCDYLSIGLWLVRSYLGLCCIWRKCSAACDRVRRNQFTTGLLANIEFGLAEEIYSRGNNSISN